MTIQRESNLITNPFRIFLEARNWHCEKIHGNQYQQGLPDLFICHPQYTSRWIECKVIETDGSIHLTHAQKIKFPILLSRGVPIYVIASDDLRGSYNVGKRERLYQKLFDEPNAHYALNRSTFHMLK